MPAMDGLTNANDMKRIREVDFVNRFTHSSLEKLIEVLGVTRKIPMMEGTTMYVYSMTGTLENGNVGEGEVIPLTEITIFKCTGHGINVHCGTFHHRNLTGYA